MNLKEMWEKYLEMDKEGNRLDKESDRLWDEGGMLLDESALHGDEELHNKGKKLWDDAEELFKEAYKLWDEASEIFWNFIKENYGNKIDYKDEDDRYILSNGIILYYDGRVHEPLEVVMRRIIKDHEEGRDESK